MCLYIYVYMLGLCPPRSGCPLRLAHRPAQRIQLPGIVSMYTCMYMYCHIFYTYSDTYISYYLSYDMNLT